jgi:hypothetical protein
VDICHKLQVLGQYLPGELEWEPIVGFAVSKQQSRQDRAVTRFPDNSPSDIDDDFYTCGMLYVLDILTNGS